MDWLIYVLLGLVQGITEWLPISSSGHLVIVEKLFDIHIPGLAFEVFLNFATFLALLVVFWRDLLNLIIGFFRYLVKRNTEDREMFLFGWFLILGTIPAAVFGLLFADVIETHLKSLTTVAVSLVITGLALYAIAKIDGHRRQLNVWDAIWVGLFQVIALIPGISRSGSTLFAALYRRLDKGLAIRYSFFLAIPVSLGTMILKADEVMEQMTGAMVLNYGLAFLVAFVSAIFAIRWFMGILERGKLAYFTYYCVAVGGAVLLYQFFLG